MLLEAMTARHLPITQATDSPGVGLQERSAAALSAGAGAPGRSWPRISTAQHLPVPALAGGQGDQNGRASSGTLGRRHPRTQIDAFREDCR